ncbi:MAG: sodium:calcium antiporter [Nanoarchaeota archaeon]|nr:sodium:calcium antiporter [Nanoarchaeota archaeon]
MVLASLFALAIGLILLIKGSDFVATHGSKIAKSLGTSEFTIGVTLVAFATSLPELAVVVGGALVGATDISIGTIIGSNIVNIALIIGLVAFLIPIPTNENYRHKELLLLAATFAFFFLLTDGLDLIEGLVLVVIGSLTFTPLRRKGPVGVAWAHIQQLWKRANVIDVGIVLVGIFMVILGAALTIEHTIQISHTLGIPEIMIATLIIALGTSLPELATSLVAAIRHHPGLSLGNIIGSNIANIMILGIAAIISPISAMATTLPIDFFFLILITGTFVVLVRFRERIPRIGGVFLLCLYIFFALSQALV